MLSCLFFSSLLLCYHAFLRSVALPLAMPMRPKHDTLARWPPGHTLRGGASAIRHHAPWCLPGWLSNDAGQSNCVYFKWPSGRGVVVVWSPGGVHAGYSCAPSIAHLGILTLPCSRSKLVIYWNLHLRHQRSSSMYVLVKKSPYNNMRRVPSDPETSIGPGGCVPDTI